MNGMVYVAGLITAITVAGAGAQDKLPPSTVWTGVSASSPGSTSNAVFTVRDTERLTIVFAVVNDGTESVPFERGDTELVINGKALAGFGEVFREGPVWRRLEPGKSFSGALGLGKEFSKPGCTRSSGGARGSSRRCWSSEWWTGKGAEPGATPDRC